MDVERNPVRNLLSLMDRGRLEDVIKPTIKRKKPGLLRLKTRLLKRLTAQGEHHDHKVTRSFLL